MKYKDQYCNPKLFCGTATGSNKKSTDKFHNNMPQQFDKIQNRSFL